MLPLFNMVCSTVCGRVTKRLREIAAELKLENSTISGILDRMEKKDLLKRQVSIEDRRYIEVVLTEKGAALEKPVLDTIETFWLISLMKNSRY